MRLETHGILQPVPAPRVRPVVDGRQDDVLALFHESPHLSVRQAAVELGLFGITSIEYSEDSVGLDPRFAVSNPAGVDGFFRA